MKTITIQLVSLLLVLSGCASMERNALLGASAATKDFKKKVPTLTTPEVRRVWIEPKIESNRYEDGHFLYVIDRPAVWGK